MGTDQTVSSLFPHGKILLCNPEHFEVFYEINPWMNIQRAPDSARTQEQWQVLHHTLLRCGVWIEYISPQKKLPDMIYTANGGLVRDQKVVLSRFKHSERSGEEAHFRRWFEHRGYTVHYPSAPFEGEGDALPMGNLLVCGSGFRSDAGVFAEVCNFLGFTEALVTTLTDPRFYHLDTCFCPLNTYEALFYPPAFTPESIKLLEKKMNLIPIIEADAVKFACNAVVFGQNVIFSAGCQATKKMLEQKGYSVFEAPMDEIMKGGGACKCLTLWLKR